MIITKKIEMKTDDGISICNITKRVKSFLAESRIRNGIVTVYTRHTTTGVRINEDETRLLKDIVLFLDRIAPINGRYLHDDISLRQCPPDERINAHSHVKALFLNSSETIPIIDGELALGEWQSIFFFDLDGSRQRELIVQIIGE